MDVLIRYEVVFFFCECLLSESVLFFTKETAKYQYEDSEEDSQDTENKEEEEKYKPNTVRTQTKERLLSA